MLGDASCFCLGNLCLPDVIEECGFAMVYMAHDGDDRSSFGELCRGVLCLFCEGLVFEVGKGYLVAKFVGDDGNGFGI